MSILSFRNQVLSISLLCSISLSAQVTMKIDATKRGPAISPYQYGLFFEEINHAGDGGLYAESVRNRSFEDATTPEYWSTTGGGETYALITDSLLNTAQKQALRLTISTASETNLKGIANTGYWGMNFIQDSTYTLSFWAKGSNTGFTGHLFAQLQSSDGSQVYGQATVNGEVSTDKWTRLTATVKATGTVGNGRLAILTSHTGQLFLDVVSLFPYTWKGRANGLRPDLAQLLADTHPRFMRFPGGCYVEGKGSYDNAFQWKRTIGPIETRPGHENNNWGYRSSDGLGFDEYLQLCQDLGAAPLFVVNVGLGHDYTIPVDDIDSLIQNTLDAIEYANGDSTTTWGARRIANGHRDPYGLKFVEIGNENYQVNSSQQSEDYAERYHLFSTAIKAKYPDIITIGNVEAWGTDNPSWRNDHPVDLVDEHYYRSYSWMRNNYGKYDRYSRAIKVYNGEYAANSSGTYGTYGDMNSALGEAVYMLGMERNSDVCRMASFAPIFMNAHDPTWTYDMIHYNASRHFCTPSYYVQKLLSQNLGKQNLLWTESGNYATDSTKVGFGSWNTEVSFDDFNVTDSAGNLLSADDFSGNDSLWTDGTGTWSITGGVKTQSLSAENCTSVNKTILTAPHYIYHVKARKDGGNEGFLLIFKYQDANNYAWWNIGGWGNTKHGIEVCSNGTKSTLASTSGSITTGTWYNLTVEVDCDTVKCYIDGTLSLQAVLPAEKILYQSAQIDEDNGLLYLKVVNPGATGKQLTLNLANLSALSGSVIRYAAQNGTDENTMDTPQHVIPSDEETLPDISHLQIPPYSLNIFKLKVSDIAPEQDSEITAYQEEDADKYGYLYAHMNASKEITNYALSKYGTYFTDLLGSGEVFDTKAFTTTGGMRDAYVMRTQNGKFILAGTDMTSALGWSSNHIIDLMLSNDLVHWDKEIKIDLESDENLKALGIDSADSLTAAWAPEVIYDPVSQKYMVYYAVGFPDRHRIYYSLVSEDLSEVSKPKLLFDPGYDVIDADIVYNALDSQYVMTYKWEGKFHLYQATARQLVPTDVTTGTCQWTVNPNFDIYEDGLGIEAPSVFRPIGSKSWRIAWMRYGGTKAYRIADLDKHCENPTNATTLQGDVEPQHGSFLKLTETEFNYLKTWEAVKTLLPTAQVYFKASQSDSIGQAITLAEAALSESGSFAEEVEAMNRALNALQTVTENYKTYLLLEAEKGHAVDMTLFLVNPQFTDGSSGWTTSSAFTQADGNVAEFWNTSFNFYQVLTDLPNGEYEVGVQSFYRAGTIDNAYAAHTAGTEKLYAQLYANADTVSIVSLYSSDAYTYDPYTYPDNVTEANTAFNTDGQYHNTVKVTLKDGTLKLGICSTGFINSHWCCFDNFTLNYLGNTSGIIQVNLPHPKDTESIYDLQGRHILGTPVHGVYIKGGKKILY